MEVLSEAMNAYDPALETLQSQGYSLFGEFEGEDGAQTWIAERTDVRLSAGTPLALLGLAALWNERGVEWRRRDVPSLYNRIVDCERITPLK